MRKIKEVLRLRSQGLHQHQIARSCAIGQSTVHHYLKRAAVAGISWPLAEEIDDAELERRLFPSPLAPVERAGLPPLDFVALHRELTTHKHVTLQLLWEEYHQVHPEGYRYSCYVAAVFMLRTEPTYWIGALSAAACSNITRGRPDYSPLRKAISGGISVRPGGV